MTQTTTTHELFQVESPEVRPAYSSKRLPALHDLLKKLKLDLLHHDDFYSTSSSKASCAKVETPDIRSAYPSERPPTSRYLAKSTSKMIPMRKLTLDGPRHDDFYTTSLSMTSSEKIGSPEVRPAHPIERPPASCDLATLIYKKLPLKKLTPNGHFHDDIYSTLSSLPSWAKVDSLGIRPAHHMRSECPSASRDLAKSIIENVHLNKLTLDHLHHDDFCATSSSMASYAKVGSLGIPPALRLRGERPPAPHDLPQFSCENPHLKRLTPDSQCHDDFYSTSSSMATCANVGSLGIRPALRMRGERAPAPHDLPQSSCENPHLKRPTPDGQCHDDFYSTSSSMASCGKVGSPEIRTVHLKERPQASHDLVQCSCENAQMKNLTPDGLLVGSPEIRPAYLKERPLLSGDQIQLIRKMPPQEKPRPDGHLGFYFCIISSAKTSCAKVGSPEIRTAHLKERPPASHNLGQLSCENPHLQRLTPDSQCPEDFYSTSSSTASSTKVSGTEVPVYTDPFDLNFKLTKMSLDAEKTFNDFPSEESQEMNHEYLVKQSNFMMQSCLEDKQMKSNPVNIFIKTILCLFMSGAKFGMA